MKSFPITLFFSILLFILNFNTIPSKLLGDQPLKDDDEEDVITTITTDNESALRDALLILWKFGGIIYIDTPEINIKTQSSLSVKGSLSGGIVGIQQSNGEYPRLNFRTQRDEVTLLYFPGLTISGSNKIIKNLIFESAGTNAIFIDGQKNTLDHVITRYNGHSGIYLSPTSDYNTFNYCYSYRNFHFTENSLPADGFTVEIGGINNIFNYCFAWENSQNGFGYYYYDGKDNIGSLTYSHSASWNNANIDVFSGRYDFGIGNPLDKNMWTIQQIIKSDEEFESNYNNKMFNLNNAIINSKRAHDYFNDYNKNNYGNGFNFGVENSLNVLSNKRTVDYCAAFDHRFKGFSSNKSQNFTGLFTNNVGFTNNVNYELHYSFAKWSNNWSWDSRNDDEFDMDLVLKEPKYTSSSKKKFYSVRDQIIKSVYANTFPDDVNFDKAIKSLTE